ncbi:long-chain acyl-CoA synthetase [Cytobacillus horneckiae]|uniref:Long-chain fatty acid--CoA ligase n=1 Tax=Cytobacillus horneckiae TaxID=549687 RepID=A0A2N0ZKV9_9BACI|nr:long-chain fatty acid--CoA ligase [Cytobacillus horneckiae]MBN6885569.1 long-chain fatty acid--CoA ligase [Cytobacillus horneckiae]MCM3180432.1 long-chain fatty acid--CoA ligase [Cytobacillus horneckiae]MEC1156319.1 long-chain fatty acid--CoA ligase [Cytobacillus horneckiae]MED2938337.1 long-chain fatty acid--CoA ligase [Cytobacillus horneckiae]PKG30149.1 long-chain fatty acid--CoA ligase [Cytobacillus horneckiae]
MKKAWHASYPESIPSEVEIPSCSIYHFLERASQDFPDHLAIIEETMKLTYIELKHAVDRFAAALHRRGFKRGDRFGIMLYNCKEYIIAYFGVQRLGGIVVQLNPMYQQHELNFMLDNSEPAWLICESSQIEKLDALRYRSKLTIVTIDRNFNENPNHYLYNWIEEENDDLPMLQINNKEDIAVLQYTGGTTGTPKGVMITHYNTVAAIYHTYITDDGALQRPCERFFGIFPMFHGAGLMLMLSCIFYAGAYIPIKHFRISDALCKIRKYRPTQVSAPPTVIVALLNHPDFQEDDLSSLKVCRSGSAPIPLEVLQAFEKKSGVRISETYGLTESNGIFIRTLLKNKDIRKTRSVGIPVPNSEVKIVDLETGLKEMPIGECGEILLKGPQIMKGYWKNPEETNRTLRNGWLYTGDTGLLDEDGFLYVVGRKKEMIIAGGYNIYPNEIDEILYQHPAVAEACTFGIPDAYRGETVKAAIVVKEQNSLTEEEIIKWCRDRLAKYKIPKQIEFREQLPKTAVGKILRRALAEEHLEQIRVSDFTKGKR